MNDILAADILQIEQFIHAATFKYIVWCLNTMRIRQHEHAVAMLHRLACCHEKRWVVIVLNQSDGVNERLAGQGAELLPGGNFLQFDTEGSTFERFQQLHLCSYIALRHCAMV